MKAIINFEKIKLNGEFPLFESMSSLKEVDYITFDMKRIMMLPMFTIIHKNGAMYFRLPTAEEKNVVSSSIGLNIEDIFTPFLMSHRLVQPESKYYKFNLGDGKIHTCFIHPDLYNYFKTFFKMNYKYKPEFTMNQVMNYVGFLSEYQSEFIDYEQAA
jgi:hypothetical protein